MSYKLENEPELSEQEYLPNLQAKLYTHKGKKKNQTNPTIYLNNPDILCINHNTLLRGHSLTGIVFLSCCFLM